MTKVYNKLVRDRIPEIIEKSGKTCFTATLSDEAYLYMLDQKLSEELAEYQESKSMEELADLVEVIAAVAQARGCPWDQLMQIRDKKHRQRGGFDKKILLLEVSDTPKKKEASYLPENAGKPWTPDLDVLLCDMFDNGISLKELCKYFKRSKSGITARLVKLGKIEKRSDISQA